MFKQLSSITSQKGRSGNLKRNVVGFMGIKVATMFIELFKVPIMLNYLDADKYGVWLTLTSIVLWVNNFDLGLSAGLRYKLAQAFTHNDIMKAKCLISTAYCSLTFIMLVTGCVLVPLVLFIDWQTLLNVSTVSNEDLRISLIAILICFLGQFVLELLGAVLKADQRAAISEVFKPIGSIVSLGLIVGLSIVGGNSLFFASLSMSVPYLFILFFASLWFYGRKYRQISPSLKSFKKSLVKDIYSIGVKFFISSVSTLVVFTSANVILSNRLGPTDVSVYNTAKTYYGLTIVFLNVVVISSCAPITEAFTKGDFPWIRRAMNATLKISTLLFAVEIVMLLVSPLVFKIWIGDKLIIPWSISISLAIYQILALYAQPYNYFLAATGKLNVNTLVSIGKIILFYPFAFYLIEKYKASGIILATILINTLPNLLVGRVQYGMIIKGTARGIWNR